MSIKQLIKFDNPLIKHDSSCWVQDSEGNFELRVSLPSLLLEEDLDDLMMAIEEEQAKRYSRRYAYGYYPSDEDSVNPKDLREYWESLGFVCSDEEWEEWEKQTELMGEEYSYYDEVWPPKVEIEDNDDGYYSGVINYDPTSKKRLKKKGKSGFASQKFINGIEVNDEEFDEYNETMRRGTRRGGKKHNKKKIKKPATRYEYNDWEEEHVKPFDNERDSIYYDEEKKIVFYRDIRNTADTYEWNNLHDFNEWLDENGISVDERDISSILYSEESHCCLNPELSDKTLIVERSFGDLVWTATDGDETRMQEISDEISRRSMYV